MVSRWVLWLNLPLLSEKDFWTIARHCHLWEIIGSPTANQRVVKYFHISLTFSYSFWFCYYLHSCRARLIQEGVLDFRWIFYSRTLTSLHNLIIVDFSASSRNLLTHSLNTLFGLSPRCLSLQSNTSATTHCHGPWHCETYRSFTSAVPTSQIALVQLSVKCAYYLPVAVQNRFICDKYSMFSSSSITINSK